MKKRVVSIFVIFVMLFLYSLSAGAIIIIDDTISTAHVYSVLPGSDEWNNLTMDEKISVSYVDENTAVRMTTEALLQTTLDYPFIINIRAYGLASTGIDIVKDYFPPLAELIDRRDAYQTIAHYLETHSETEGVVKYVIARDLLRYVTDGVQVQSILDPITGERVAQVVTPKGSYVMVYSHLTWDNFEVTYEEAHAIELEYEVLYQATLLRNASPEYNCHSYAWHNQTSANHYWMNSPTRYTIDGSYSAGTRAVGNKVTYKDSEGRYSHSGIVTENNKITSKWGCLGLFEHDLENCPYYFDSVPINYWVRNP